MSLTSHTLYEGVSNPTKNRSKSLRIILIPRLHDTTGCQVGCTTQFDNWFNNRLYRVNGASGLPLADPGRYFFPTNPPRASHHCLNKAAVYNAKLTKHGFGLFHRKSL